MRVLSGILALEPKRRLQARSGQSLPLARRSPGCQVPMKDQVLWLAGVGVGVVGSESKSFTPISSLSSIGVLL